MTNVICISCGPVDDMEAHIPTDLHQSMMEVFCPTKRLYLYDCPTCGHTSIMLLNPEDVPDVVVCRARWCRTWAKIRR